MSKFKAGDLVVCIDNYLSNRLTVGEEYKVKAYMYGFVYLEGIDWNYSPGRFRLAETKTPIWNNKRPKDMNEEELKAFICDRIDGVEMCFTRPVNGEIEPVEYVGSLADSAKLYVSEWVYCVKPPKSEQLQAAEKALEDAQAAVKAAQEAVAKAKES